MTTKEVFKKYDWVDITEDVDWNEGSYTHPKEGVINCAFAGTKSKPRFGGPYVRYFDFNGVGFIRLQFLIFKRRVYVLHLETKLATDVFYDSLDE